MGKVFEGEDGIIRATTPVAPPVGQRSLYPKADGWYDLDSDGVEMKLSAVTTPDGEVKITEVTLTASQIASMHLTPILVVEGQPGKVIQVANMVSLYTYGGVAFTGGGITTVVEETSLIAQASTLSAAAVQGVVNFVQASQGQGTNKTVGKGLMATNTLASFAAGNGTIKHIITYQYITV